MRRIACGVALVAAACASSGSGAPTTIVAATSSAASSTIVSEPSIAATSVATPSTATVTAPATSASTPCRRYRSERRGELPSALTELSGWALSKRHAGVLWGHNDSGDDARLVAVSVADGSLVADVEVAGASATDWEDVATYTDAGGQHWIVVADVGDNGAARRNVSLVLIPDPALPTTTMAAAGTVTVRWADGPHDVEALVLDPLSGDAIFVGKRFSGAPQVSVDRVAAASLTPGATVTSEQVGTFAVPVGERFGPTAGSIDAAGTTIALLFYSRTMTWTRAPGTSVAETILAGTPCTVPSGAGQYESLAIADDGTLLTATEGKAVPLVALVPAT